MEAHPDPAGALPRLHFLWPVEWNGPEPRLVEDAAADPRLAPAAERLRIYNKFGQAYGFSTENALVVDSSTGKSFFFAATIYTNADGVLNDDRYDYATAARPFFAELGEGLAELLK